MIFYIAGRSAFIGIGFGDRSDSFDLNVALQDHFKWLKKEKQITDDTNKPELDLRFKEGETIKINMKITVCITYCQQACLNFFNEFRKKMAPNLHLSRNHVLVAV